MANPEGGSGEARKWNRYSRRTPWHGIAGVLVFGLAVGVSAPVRAEEGTQPRLVVDKWSSEYDHFFQQYAKRYFGPFFDWRWFKAQAIAESLLDAKAESHKGAKGVMQILPSTFEEIRRKNPQFTDINSPRWNIAAGIYYSRTLYRKWRSTANQNERFLLALASYNAGYKRIAAASRRVTELKRWDDIKNHAPGETRFYVARIRSLMAEQKSGGITRVSALDDFSKRTLQ